MRKKILSSLKSFDKEEESRWIVSRLTECIEYKEAQNILAFIPLKSEPDISPILSDERIALPYIENNEMHFSASRSFSKSKLGFLEPTHIEIEYEKALMIVPLVAFDKSLNRLGRGGGFYDRYIASNRDRLYTIGIALSPSFVDEIPSDKLDQKLDRIICPAL